MLLSQQDKCHCVAVDGEKIPRGGADEESAWCEVLRHGEVGIIVRWKEKLPSETNHPSARKRPLPITARARLGMHTREQQWVDSMKIYSLSPRWSRYVPKWAKRVSKHGETPCLLSPPHYSTPVLRKWVVLSIMSSLRVYRMRIVDKHNAYLCNFMPTWCLFVVRLPSDNECRYTENINRCATHESSSRDKKRPPISTAVACNISSKL